LKGQKGRDEGADSLGDRDKGTTPQPFSPTQKALRAYAKHFTRLRKILYAPTQNGDLIFGIMRIIAGS